MKKISPQTSVTLDLAIEGMSCGACAAKIQRQVGSLPGVEEVTVNFADGSLHATTIGHATDRIVAAVEQLGYHVSDDAQPLSLAIGGMHCSNCANKIQQQIGQLPGVEQVEVSYAAGSLRAIARPSQLAAVQAIIESLGYESFESSSARRQSAYEKRRQLLLVEERQLLRMFIVGAICSLPLMINMTVMLAGSTPLPHWLEFVLATPVQLLLGQHFYRGAWRALRAGYANMDVLVALGTSAAYLLSVYNWLFSAHGELYFETSAVVLTLVFLGKWLESRTKRRTSSAVESLIELAPKQATVVREGEIFKVNAEQLRVGDTLRIKPGEKVAADCVVTAGQSELDESLLTGESQPVLRASGDQLVAGAINGSGALEARVIAVGENSSLGKIIHWVEQAQSSKAPIQRLVDKVSLFFVPTVVAIAAITLVGWGWLGNDWSNGILCAAAVLVIACPCALGLATPAAIMAGNGVAAAHGILFRDVDALQSAVNVDTVVFDKTGTLTEGKPVLDAIQFFDPHPDDTLSLLYGLQLRSEHPLATAVVNYAEQKQLQPTPVDSARALVGRGIEGELGARRLLAGSQRLMEERDITIESAAKDIYERLCASGATVMWFCIDDQAVAVYSISDPLRSTAASAIQLLHQRGFATHMLTGDQQSVAARVAQTLGMEHFTAEARPDAKAAAISNLQDSGMHIAMVGDGINDAPALARADIGVAMGSGTDVAAETAGITLLRSDPLLVADCLDIAHRTYRKIKQNLWWAFLFNSAGIPLAAAGLLNPMIAGAAMAFSSVMVVSNALLLQRWQPPSTG